MSDYESEMEWGGPHLPTLALADHMWEEAEMDKFIFELVEAHAETEKLANRSRGWNAGESELSRRNFLDSQKEEKMGKGEKYFWITVNCKPDVDLSVFVETIHKMYSKKWIENFFYVFEIGGENQNKHCHGLIKATYQLSRAKKELGNSVKDLCNINISSCFYFACVKTEDVALEKISYMLGQKCQDKVPHFEESKIWRAENNLNEFYAGGSYLVSPPELINNSESELIIDI